MCRGGEARDIHVETDDDGGRRKCGGASMPGQTSTRSGDILDKWEGDGVGNDVRFVVRDNGDLVISSVTWSDMGQYTCTAKNIKGTSYVNTFLYPLAQGV